jgi:hypothetical protein
MLKKLFLLKILQNQDLLFWNYVKYPMIFRIIHFFHHPHKLSPILRYYIH